MKNNRIKYYLFFLCVLLAKMQFASAGETFQNNLLKADISQSSLGGVKVTLYTSKPYNDSVVVNKKSDYEYVILMPETSNSLTAKPAIKAVSEMVNNIEVKTQQYDNQVKGYTKIVISTSKPISIAPQVQTVTVKESLGEKEYMDLISQAAKKETNTFNKEVKKAVSGKNEAVKSAQAAKTSATQKSSQKPTLRAVPTKSLSQKVVTKQKTKETLAKVVVPTKPQVVTESKSTETTVLPEQKVQTLPVKQEQVANIVPSEVLPSKVVPIDNSIKAKLLRKYAKYKNIIKNNLYMALGFVALTFLLLLLGARKMSKNLHKQKENFKINLEEMPAPVTDYTQKINDDMTWKEKFQTYVEATQGAEESAEEGSIKKEEAFLSSPELDDLFNEESFNAESFEDEPQEKSFTADSESIELTNVIFEEQIEEPKQASSSNIWGELDSQSYQSELDVSLDSLFGEEEFIDEETFNSDYYDENKKEEISQEPVNEFIKSEFAIDDNKGFYLVDYEDTTALVGHIAEEVFVLKRFDSKIQGDIQARLNEQKPNSMSYMTRVGAFRGVVEVTPHDMNLLIEL